MEKANQVNKAQQRSLAWRSRIPLLAAMLPVVAVLAVVVGSLFSRNQLVNPASGFGGPGDALVRSGPTAPDFSVRTMDGSSFRLSEHAGNVRLLFFTGVG